MFSLTSPSQLPQTPNLRVSLGHFSGFSGAGAGDGGVGVGFFRVGAGVGVFGVHGPQEETQVKKRMLRRTRSGRRKEEEEEEVLIEAMFLGGHGKVKRDTVL